MSLSGVMNATGVLEALLVHAGLEVPDHGVSTLQPEQLYSLFNADVPVTDLQVRMTQVTDDFRRFERQTDSRRVIGARDRALRVAFSALADNMAAFSAGCQLTPDLITSVALCRLFNSLLSWHTSSSSVSLTLSL